MKYNVLEENEDWEVPSQSTPEYLMSKFTRKAQDKFIDKLAKTVSKKLENKLDADKISTAIKKMPEDAQDMFLYTNGPIRRAEEKNYSWSEIPVAISKKNSYNNKHKAYIKPWDNTQKMTLFDYLHESGHNVDDIDGGAVGKSVKSDFGNSVMKDNDEHRGLSFRNSPDDDARKLFSKDAYLLDPRLPGDNSMFEPHNRKYRDNWAIYAKKDNAALSLETYASMFPVMGTINQEWLNRYYPSAKDSFLELMKEQRKVFDEHPNYNFLVEEYDPAFHPELLDE